MVDGALPMLAKPFWKLHAGAVPVVIGPLLVADRGFPVGDRALICTTLTVAAEALCLARGALPATDNALLVGSGAS